MVSITRILVSVSLLDIQAKLVIAIFGVSIGFFQLVRNARFLDTTAAVPFIEQEMRYFSQECSNRLHEFLPLKTKSGIVARNLAAHVRC